ncbi:MAG: hypothetical protein WAV22_10570 [Porticoccaceae bacterium]
MKRALIVGGTGPTGPHVIQGLLERGYATTIFHRGAHEPPGLPEVEHIHGDPHFPETIAAALDGREFELVVAMYGRIRHLADYFARRCARFIGVGGIPVYAGLMDPEGQHPWGLPVPVRETAPLSDYPGDTDGSRFAHMIYRTERHVLNLGEAGAFNAAYFRYPAIYGPRQPTPMEWSVVRRVRDGRSAMILPNGGLILTSRCAARNAAEYLLLAIDRPDASRNQAYNCTDDEQFTQRQWVELIARGAGRPLDIFSLPEELAIPAEPLTRMLGGSNHCLLDNAKARHELGYRDRVSARDALQETAAWYLANPLAGNDAANHPDPFDYAAEDRLIAAYQRGVAAIQAEAPFPKASYHHSYAHPKTPGQGPDHRGR